MVQEITLHAVAQELAEAFETRTRTNGNEFVRVKDSAQGKDYDSWVYKAVNSAHGEALPNDSIFGMCSRVADALEEVTREHEVLSIEDLDMFVRLESLVPVSNHELKQWLLENPNADEAIEELATESGYFSDLGDGFDLYKMLSAAYMTQLEHIASVLASAIQKEFDRRLEESES